MIGAGSRAGRGRRDQFARCPPRLTHGGPIMRIRRTILAPAILVIGTSGALTVGPVLAVTATQSAAIAASAATPHIMGYHG